MFCRGRVLAGEMQGSRRWAGCVITNNDWSCSIGIGLLSVSSIPSCKRLRVRDLPWIGFIVFLDLGGCDFACNVDLAIGACLDREDMMGRITEASTFSDRILRSSSVDFLVKRFVGSCLQRRTSFWILHRMTMDLGGNSQGCQNLGAVSLI